MRKLIDSRPAITALVIFVVLAALSWFFTAISFTLPEPAAWLEAWVKLFQTVVSVVIGLKLAWSVPELLQELLRRTRTGT